LLFSTGALISPLPPQNMLDHAVDNVGLLGTSNSVVTLAFISWCDPKWFQDEFNNQSQILQDLGTTS
jgi:hypothetical protein